MLRPTRVLLATLLIGCSTSVDPSQDPTAWCGSGAPVSGDLAAAIQAARDGDTLRLAPGDYPAVVVDRAITLVGLDAKGECLPALGEGGPVLAGLTLSGAARAGGLSIRGPLVASDTAQVRRVAVSGAETCVTLSGQASIDGFEATGCQVGMVASGGDARNGLLVKNRGDGVQATGTLNLSWLTVADNGGDGVRLLGDGAVLVNSVLATNHGYGLWQDGAPQTVQRILFSANGRGQYGAPKLAVGQPAFTVGKGMRSGQLLPGDIEGAEPPLAVDGVLRSFYVESLAWGERYTPAQPLQLAWQLWPNPVDALGKPRRLDTRIGAVESGVVADPPATALLVSPDGVDGGDGSEAKPFRTVQAAVDAAASGQTVQVLAGTYVEEVYVSHKDIRLIGVRREGGALVPLTDPADPGLPVIDPSSGVHHFGVFLDNVGYHTLIQGLAIRGTLSAIVVLERGEEGDARPKLVSLRIEDNRKGVDTDVAGGEITDCLFRRNRIGVTLRAVSQWQIEHNVMEDNGVDVTFTFTMLEADKDSTVRNNTFSRGGGLRLDTLMARGGRKLLVSDNTFDHSTLVVGLGGTGASVEISGNRFQASDLVVRSPGSSAPLVAVRANVFAEGGSLQVPAGWPAGDTWTHGPDAAPGLDGGFTAEERRLGTSSSPIVARSGQVYAVGADFDGLGIFDADGHRSAFVPTGNDPRSVALAPDGRLALVANFGAGTLSFVDTVRGRSTAELAVGVEPYGVVIDPAGRTAYVSLAGEDRVVRVDIASRRVTGSVDGLPAQPRGLAIYGEGAGQKLLVTHFVPGRLPGVPEGATAGLRPQLTFIDLPDFRGHREIDLPQISSPHFLDASPNLMQSVVVRGDRAYLPSFGATLESPLEAVRNGRGLAQFETTEQALLTVVDVVNEVPLPDESANLSLPGNPVNGPYGIAFAEDSDLAAVPLYGNDSLVRIVVQPHQPPRFVRAWRAGLDLITGGNPRGAALMGDRAYAVDFSTGDMTTVDLTTALNLLREPLGPAEVDRLDERARRGKQLFYSTFKVATTANFWISCGTCHPDGRTDNLSWGFAHTGPRSTQPLAGSMETLPIHFEADRDELADFENTVRDLQGGISVIDGPVPPAVGGARIGDRAGGWADIEAYLRQGIDAPRAPPSTGREELGRLQFNRLGCTTCHGGLYFTSSHLPADGEVKAGRLVGALIDVGTNAPGDTGPMGWDPPSLWGVAQTGPYLHDGSAATLADVLANPRHLFAGVSGTPPTLTGAELAALLDYVRSIDGATPAPELAP